MMEYKGYTAKIEFDDEAGLFHGQVLNLRDVITFQGRSVDELREEFTNSVEDYLAFCAERGEKPEKPFSGRFALRIEPSLHRAAAIAASRAGESLNAWIAKVLEQQLVKESRPAHSVAHSMATEYILYAGTQNKIFSHFDADAWMQCAASKQSSYMGPGQVVQKSRISPEHLDQLLPSRPQELPNVS